MHLRRPIIAALAALSICFATAVEPVGKQRTEQQQPAAKSPTAGKQTAEEPVGKQRTMQQQPAAKSPTAGKQTTEEPAGRQPAEQQQLAAKSPTAGQQTVEEPTERQPAVQQQSAGRTPTTFRRTGARSPARHPIGIAFYDADRLYDTLPALFYNDTDYTPEGRYGWNTARYGRKIRNTAAVIDSMGLPLVAVWGVENEAVVRDLAAACKGDYTYLHRTLNTFDGMDFALFYYGDVFYPEYIEEGRRYLYIEGLLGRDTVGLVLCAEDRMAEWVVRDLREERPGVKLVVAGRSATTDPATYGLRDAQARAAEAGRGTIRSRGRWSMRERILVDTAFRIRRGDVFARRYLIDPKSGNPLTTYSRGVYRGGYGYSLPVYVYIE